MAEVLLHQRPGKERTRLWYRNPYASPLFAGLDPDQCPLFNQLHGIQGLTMPDKHRTGRHRQGSTGLHHQLQASRTTGLL